MTSPGLPAIEFGPLNDHGEPTRAHAPPTTPTRETNWGEYIDSQFGLDDDGGMHCLKCGSYVRPGWQFDHYDELHKPRLGLGF